MPRQLKHKKGWVYILKCADDSYYTGSTNNLKLRLLQHQSGKGSNHTKNRLPVQLVYSEEYQDIKDAFHREKQIQGWCREKKEALINNEFRKLPELSKSYSPKKVLPEPVEGNLKKR